MHTPRLVQVSPLCAKPLLASCHIRSDCVAMAINQHPASRYYTTLLYIHSVTLEDSYVDVDIGCYYTMCCDGMIT